MKLLLIALIFMTSLFAATTPSEENRLCEVFTKKVNLYKQNMRNDKYAVHTLKSYEKRAKEYCKKQ